jgi:hypothetical protein
VRALAAEVAELEAVAEAGDLEPWERAWCDQVAAAARSLAAQLVEVEVATGLSALQALTRQHR